jgi:hypothetical protein
MRKSKAPAFIACTVAHVWPAAHEDHRPFRAFEDEPLQLEPSHAGQVQVDEQTTWSQRERTLENLVGRGGALAA